MTRKCLVLSTPDLRDTAILLYMGDGFEKVCRPRLNTLEGYRVEQIDTKITEMNQRLFLDQQAAWYQDISMTPEFLKSDLYSSMLDDILVSIESQSCLVHDPLLVHSLPLWLSKLENPSLVFYYSHPLECAYHLQQTWRFPLSVGLALWENFVLRACKKLQQKTPALISTNKARNSPTNHLDSVFESLSIPKSDRWTELLQTTRNLSWETLDLDFDHQSVIFSQLEEGDVSSVASLELSAQSLDTLEYYGQLRAGFEFVKAERDQLREKLSLSLQDSSEVGQAKPSQNDCPLSTVRAHIEGMETVEFFAEPDSPIIEMLRNALANPAQDELVYLNYGDDESDALYFMSSSLLALEIAPQVPH